MVNLNTKKYTKTHPRTKRDIDGFDWTSSRANQNRGYDRTLETYEFNENEVNSISSDSIEAQGHPRSLSVFNWKKSKNPTPYAWPNKISFRVITYKI